jgi:hypothetical protein
VALCGRLEKTLDWVEGNLGKINIRSLPTKVWRKIVQRRFSDRGQFSIRIFKNPSLGTYVIEDLTIKFANMLFTNVLVIDFESLARNMSS